MAGFRGLFVGALSLAFASMGCIPKKGTKSGTQSLDNLAAGQKITDNVCMASGTAPALLPQWQGKIKFGTDLSSKVAKDVQDRYIKKVEQYLSAVPEDIQKAFLDWGGQILLTGKASERCGQAFVNDPKSAQYTAEGASKIDSCFIYAGGADGTATAGQAVFAIYHQINESEIVASSSTPDQNEKRLMHGGVRAFGMVLSQFYAKLLPKDGSKDLRPQRGNFKLGLVDTFEMSNVKEQIANRFLLDVAQSTEFKLENLEPLLGKGSAKAIRDGVLDPATGKVKAGDINALKPLDLATYVYDGESQVSPDQRQVRIQRMKDFAFGDAFDSKNCSDASRTVLHEKFQLTEAVYSQVNQVLIDFAKLLKDPSSAAQAVAQGGSQGSVASSQNLTENRAGMNLAPGGLGGVGGLQGIMQLFSMFRGLGGGLGGGIGGVGGIGNAPGGGIGGIGGGIGSNRPLGSSNVAGLSQGIGQSQGCPNCATCMGDGCASCGGSCANGQCMTGGCSTCSGGTCSSCSGGCACSGGSFG